jgi:hypothetical protein
MHAIRAFGLPMTFPQNRCASAMQALRIAAFCAADSAGNAKIAQASSNPIIAIRIRFLSLFVAVSAAAFPTTLDIRPPGVNAPERRSLPTFGSPRVEPKPRSLRHKDKAAHRDDVCPSALAALARHFASMAFLGTMASLRNEERCT